MSSLQCPARVFVARHGEAEYETDLCTDDGGSLTPRAASRPAARSALRGERIARVWTSPLSRAVQTAEIVAGLLGVDVVVREGLREYGVGALAGTTMDERATSGRRSPLGGRRRRGRDPGGERVDDVVARVTGGPRGGRRPAPRRGGPGRQPRRRHPGRAAAAGRIRRSACVGLTLPNCGVIELEADADGWRLVRWDGV